MEREKRKGEREPEEKKRKSRALPEAAAKVAKRANRINTRGYCEHGCRKSFCKDCGTGHCEHGRRMGSCSDCGTGRCEHENLRNLRNLIIMLA
jgi:hypothetical protein